MKLYGFAKYGTRWRETVRRDAEERGIWNSRGREVMVPNLGRFYETRGCHEKASSNPAWWGLNIQCWAAACDYAIVFKVFSSRVLRLVLPVRNTSGAKTLTFRNLRSRPIYAGMITLRRKIYVHFRNFSKKKNCSVYLKNVMLKFVKNHFWQILKNPLDQTGIRQRLNRLKFWLFFGELISILTKALQVYGSF